MRTFTMIPTQTAAKWFPAKIAAPRVTSVKVLVKVEENGKMVRSFDADLIAACERIALKEGITTTGDVILNEVIEGCRVIAEVL